MENNEYYVDLRELLMDIWHHKAIILTITILFILMTGIYSFFLAEPVYEVSSEIYTPEFRLLNDNVITHNEYLSFLRNTEIKEKLIERYNSGKDYNITMKNLDKKININRQGNNVLLRFRDTDDKLAAKLLNDWVGLFSARVKNYVNTINSNYLNNLETLMLERYRAYLKAEETLTEFEKNSKLGLIKAQLKTKTNKLVNLEEKSLDINKDIMILSKEIDLLSEQLQKTEQFIITNETIDDSSMKVIHDLIKGNDSIQLNVKKENINSIYTNLSCQYNQTYLDLNVNKEEYKVINTDISNLNKEIAGLKEKEAVLNEEKKRLEMRADERMESYQQARQEYSRMQQKLTKAEDNITVINRAYIPESPISPNKKLNLVIAAVLGFPLGISVVFVKNYFAFTKHPEKKNSKVEKIN